MKNSLEKLSLVSLIFVFLVLACDLQDNPQTTRRGRLEFIRGITGINYFKIDGKKWSPENDPNFGEKIDWCNTSPNPNLEILLCESFSNESEIYVLRMNGESVDVQKLDNIAESIWTNDDGRWLLFVKFFYNIETNEKIEIKHKFLKADEEIRNINYVKVPYKHILAISPDMKTIVQKLRELPSKKGEDEFWVVQLVDLETGKSENYIANLTKYSWLKEYDEPKSRFAPPPESAKNFEWEKDSAGKDKVKVPVWEKYSEKEQKAK